MRLICISVMMLFSVSSGIAANDTIGFFKSEFGEINFTIHDIQEVSFTKDKATYSVGIRLKKLEKKRLADLTTLSSGKRIVLSICKEQIIAPVVNAPILSGLVSLTDIEASLALKIIRVLQGEIDCEYWKKT